MMLDIYRILPGRQFQYPRKEKSFAYLCGSLSYIAMIRNLDLSLPRKIGKPNPYFDRMAFKPMRKTLLVETTA
jgi:hypothetical protein